MSHVVASPTVIRRSWRSPFANESYVFSALRHARMAFRFIIGWCAYLTWRLTRWSAYRSMRMTLWFATALFHTLVVLSLLCAIGYGVWECHLAEQTIDLEDRQPTVRQFSATLWHVAKVRLGVVKPEKKTYLQIANDSVVRFNAEPKVQASDLPAWIHPLWVDAVIHDRASNQ